VPFTALRLHPDLLKGVHDLGFTRPTPIQADAIPAAMQGRDVLACAMTGSGKTVAFVLPLLHRLLQEERRRGTRVLVLTPTRELAAQILEEVNALAMHTPLSAAAVYGGVGMGPQEHAFRSGVDVMIATPGRLLDHFRAPYAKLAALEYLVLDEADRMLDMGFLPDIRRIMRHLPPRRQTLFFSATMPPPIAALASEMLKNPVTINLQRQAAPPVGITQAVYPVPQDLKPALFLALVQRDLVHEALVFTRTKHRANRLYEYLLRHGISAARIHGNRSQAQRTEALAGFKSGKYRALVATDIAARGIDVEALSHVVNFDVPAVPEDYIHRVGRTGRAELTGDAFTFVAPAEEGELRAIERAIGRTLPRITLPDFDYAAAQATLEIPLAERIAAIRRRKAEERSRSRARQGSADGRPVAGGRGRSPQRSGEEPSSSRRPSPAGAKARAHPARGRRHQPPPRRRP
jgi:ATP-dependent RNA helicase RhlE